jgi:hypothetical protein
VDIVEGTPTISHVYSKKILYLFAPPYWAGIVTCTRAENYDRQGKLWRAYNLLGRPIMKFGGEPFAGELSPTTYDFQCDQ